MQGTEKKQLSTQIPYESPSMKIVELKNELGILQASQGGGGMPGGQPAEPF